MVFQSTANPLNPKEIHRLANIMYFRSGVFQHTEWMGIEAAKCPMDMWVYQELMFRLKTDLVVETGTWKGGSALFFAHILDLLGHGRLVTVDINLPKNLPQHHRIKYIQGSSTEPGVLNKIDQYAAEAKSVLVILDSDHKADYKLEELNHYAKFVTTGSYLIAEDSVFDFYPAWPEFGPGPAQAVQKFIHNNSEFEIDRTQERHMISFCPAAFLKRTHAQSP